MVMECGSMFIFDRCWIYSGLWSTVSGLEERLRGKNTKFCCLYLPVKLSTFASIFKTSICLCKTNPDFASTNHIIWNVDI